MLKELCGECEKRVRLSVLQKTDRLPHTYRARIDIAGWLAAASAEAQEMFRAGCILMFMRE
jgi:hypothetical protein